MERPGTSHAFFVLFFDSILNSCRNGANFMKRSALHGGSARTAIDVFFECRCAFLNAVVNPFLNAVFYWHGH